MNRTILILFTLSVLAGCKNNNNVPKRLPLAEVGNVILYYDEVPQLLKNSVHDSDSTAIIQNYINKWAKRQLLLMKAEDNLSPETRSDIENQLKETRANLVIYQYQQKMMLEKMDTVVTDAEMESYYSKNKQSFLLSSNIVKALFIKLPAETPDINKIISLARSGEQKDIQKLDSYGFQFAEKFDDFNEKWVPMDRLLVELPDDIENQENFLRRRTFYETSDSASVYLISIRDYRLRSTLAPFEYVKNDIKRIIWNSRRYDFLQSLENGIYNEALKENSFKIFK
jgi:hypothetical protein